MPIKSEQLRNTSDDEPVWAEYSDGSRRKLSITAGEVKAKSRTPRVWGDATLYQRQVRSSGHVLSIKQHCDKVLRMSLYERSSQILTVNVDCFGDLGGKTKVLERYHPAVVACLDFIRPIADAYAEGRLLEGELTSERNSRLARIKKMQKADGEKDKPKRSRISTKQPAGAKKSGYQTVDADQHTSGGDRQETNADGTSQPIKKPTGSQR